MFLLGNFDTNVGIDYRRLRRGGALTTCLSSLANFAYPGGFFGTGFCSSAITPPYRAVVLRVPDAVKHEPRGLLSDLQRPCDFVGTNSVVAGRKHPHRGEPFVEADRRILEDRTDLDRELLPAFEAGPHPARFEKRQALGLASRAFRAFGPFRVGNSFEAHHRVGEVPDSPHQAIVYIEVNCFHASMIAPEAKIVAWAQGQE